MCKQTENTPFCFSFFPGKLWPFLYFSQIVVSVLSRTNLKKKKASFPLVGWCMINTVSENHIPTCNIEWGIADQTKIGTLAGPARTRHDFEHHRTDIGVYPKMFVLLSTRGVAPAAVVAQAERRVRCATGCTALSSGPHVAGHRACDAATVPVASLD